MTDDSARVAFDRHEYDRLRSVVDEVASTTSDALWNAEGYSIGPELRGQPAAASWDIASQLGTSVSSLAGQVRTHTEALCEKTMPDYLEQLGKAEQLFEQTDDLSTSTAADLGGGA
ncbi:hypothetical protein [Mycetocola reblochoni]|uniref:Uncharacterized protein n=2 Tax=Mycetocola reblochoni TaxID=331618 RepID=A0A1R4I8K6_9MICO|nr:hypothetical protein [Mycetocola reblochoni]RLP68938.1 hypothetical protein D9V30_08665 [Mycetocola reblochoni]SJN16175.1 hypothetical protein FM119_00400 [Mycetocola reblochoni REB411]